MDTNEPEQFTESARAIWHSPDYALKCARAGLIPHVVTSGGYTLFRKSARQQLEAIKAATLARRGRYIRKPHKVRRQNSAHACTQQ